jgi:mRNA-decapping enzyme subunit 2
MDAHSLPPPDSVNMLDLIPDPEDDVADEENVFRDMDLPEILEDLNARFLVNLPREEMNLLRVYWQAEQA